MSIILSLLVIAVLVLVHEWGHFVAARKIGVPVYEFAIGMGPTIFSRTENGVIYSVRAFPIGGFVKMAGEESGDLEVEDGFANRKPWEKIVVSLAGPLMNFVFAIVLFIILFAGIGIPTAIEQPVIGEIMAGQPSETAGLEAGDLILAVDGVDVDSWTAFTGQVAALEPGTEATFTVQRGGEVLTLTLIPVTNPDTGKSMIGVINKVEYHKQGLLTSIKSGFKHTYIMTVALLGGLLEMLAGNVSSDDIAGPVGIVSLIGDTAKSGAVNLLSFMGFLSINLGVINLLPIPALDGSKIIFAVIESIRKKPFPVEKEAMVHLVGFFFLMGLIVFATYNDILRIFNS